MIEKRYRTNLNDKIAALRNSVPSLRIMSRSQPSGQADDDNEDLEGLTPAHKLNKATVLSKATEYIRHLEKRNKRLSNENDLLKQRLENYDKIAMANPVPLVAGTPDGIRYAEDPFANHHSPTAHSAPQGMIPVPENIMNLHRAAVNGRHYAPQQSPYPVYNRQAVAQQHMVNARGGSNLMSKMMVGSLAGLMFLEGWSERESQSDDTSARGLSAIPLTLRNLHALTSKLSLSAIASGNGLLPLLRVVLLFGALVYFVSPFLHFQPKSKKKAIPLVRLSPAPSPASPIEVRRKAWLTAIQTVWVPQHNIGLEVAALASKMVKLSTRRLIGWQGYALLTGATKEQEVARIKAWDIALEAQLTGGDAEISVSRLVLTIMASGTLPDTPLRLMLKALHIRILLWEIARKGYGTWYPLEDFSARWARSFWNAARCEFRLLSKSQAKEQLPDHLAALLQLDCGDVLVDDIIQRAYNLAWNKPGAEDSMVDEGMDGVIEDFAIASPLDALAAWQSSLSLRATLEAHLDQKAEVSQEEAEERIDMAIRTAPPTSGAHTRAMTAKALLFENNRMVSIATAFAALSGDPTSTTTTMTRERESEPSTAAASTTRELSASSLPMNFIIPSGPIPADLKLALTFAKCLHIASSLPNDAHPRAVHISAAMLNKQTSYPSSLTLLSFVSALKILDAYAGSTQLFALSKPGLERLAGAMRIWIGGAEGRRVRVDRGTREWLVEKCLRVGREVVGMKDEEDADEDEVDAGYVSQEEGEVVIV